MNNHRVKWIEDLISFGVVLCIIVLFLLNILGRWRVFVFLVFIDLTIVFCMLFNLVFSDYKCVFCLNIHVLVEIFDIFCNYSLIQRLFLSFNSMIFSFELCHMALVSFSIRCCLIEIRLLLTFIQVFPVFCDETS